MSTVKDSYFRSSDGVNDIRVRQWRDEAAPPMALLQISHGIVEHIERYGEFAEYMAKRGYIVFGGDHLGHGKSVKTQDDLGYFGEKDGWTHIVDDIHTLHNLSCGENPNLPCFILGHSMGSFLLRTYLIRYPDDQLSGALISGTGQQSKLMIAGGIALAGFEKARLGARGKSAIANKLSLGSYNKFFEPARTPHDWLSRDEKKVDENLADPLCNFDPTVSALLEMLKGIRFIGRAENAAKMRKNLPILFFSGDKDPVGEQGRGVNRAEKIFLNAGMKNVRKMMYPEGRHEMLNETNRLQVYEDIYNWTQQYI